MSRAAKIEEIRARRVESAVRAEELGAHLTRVGAALADLERVRADLHGRVEDDALDRLVALGPALRDLSDRITRERAALDRALTRLRRATLNIGVVGRARQGKSRFLQSLTGLTAREIPDGAGRFCTGVPSLIHHLPDGPTHADVYFHSNESFLDDVIGPYYDRYGLGARPVSPAQFGTTPLPPLAAERRTPETESAYGHLKAYHEAYPEYAAKVGAPSPLRVGADEIRGHVAQDDERGRRLHAFRAVRRVEIATRFPRTDLAGVGVIDLPGLGDTNLGDSRVLLSALQDDVDIVLFLRRPAPEGDGVHDYDIDLYGIAQSALPEIPMERRSFLILNHRRSADQDNLASARSYLEQVAGSPIRVVGAYIADCSDPDEVVGAFDPIVDHLLDNIGSLDRMLLGERARRVAEIDREARLLVRDAASMADLAQPGGLWFPVFQALFDDAHQDLSNALEDLVREYRDERDSPDPAFARAVAAIVERARENDGIPSAAEIGNRFNVDGSQAAAYGHLLDETRAHLSRHFLELDDALSDCVRQMWTRIADVLRGPGQLQRLSDRTGREFLEDLAAQIPGRVRRDGPSEIRYALQILAEFELSYRGFIQHRIRPCLDGMHADQPTIPFPQDGAPPGEQGVREMLDITYREALYRCETALEDLLAEPHGAVFAIVEEFRDRVLRSHGTRNEWRAFYQEIRAVVWAGKFSALAEETLHMRVWSEAVQRLSALLDDREGPANERDEAEAADEQ